jgi:hypothetical protein
MQTEGDGGAHRRAVGVPPEFAQGLAWMRCWVEEDHNDTAFLVEPLAYVEKVQSLRFVGRPWRADKAEHEAMSSSVLGKN